MKELFLNFIQSNRLFSAQDKILVAVSGGVDSMALLHLLHSCSFNIAVAHCNFGLRGGESDAEQALVERTCARMGVKCYVVRFDTRGQCIATGESTQMAARRLRYDFFEQLCAEQGFTKIAIAHHCDDSTETFFINLTRGTGLRGLTGISSTNGKVVRPLLFTSRDEIEKYAIDNSLDYLTDSSNLSDDYLRNRLRHDILPRMGSMSSAFGRTMGANITRLESAQRFIDTQVAQISSLILKDGILDMDMLSHYGEPHFLLFELLYPMGFSPETIADIGSATLSGKRFYADLYVATLDRSKLLIHPRKASAFEPRTISEDDEAIEWLTTDDFASLQTPANVALLSADALQFPLRIDRWQAGDWFVPLGMHSQKKVSDFLIDCKISLPEKEKQGVLMSGDSIIWLIGRRIDDRYKVTESTKRVIRISL